jgi:hypothetical protein
MNHAFLTLCRRSAPALALALTLASAIPAAAATQSGLAAPAPTVEPYRVALPDEPVQQLRLRDGRILWCWIEDHSPEDFEVLRLDNGGRAALPWSLLDPAQEQELKALYGYVDLSAQEPTVPAVRLSTVSGDEFVGVVLSESPQVIEFKTVNGILRIPRTQLAGPLVQEQVPAREVYTRDELYSRRLEEYTPALLDAEVPAADRAEMHFEIGRYCESIFDFAHALFHYRAIVELESDFDHPDLAASLERAERLARDQAQADELDQIDRLRLRDEFPEALARIERFAELYPDSPLSTELLELRSRVLRDRERVMLRETEQRWHHWAWRLAREQAREDDYEATTLWIQEAMSDQIVALVQADLSEYQADVNAARVRSLWSEREGRRLQRATYGVGTWLIGRDAARAEVVPEEDEDDSDSARDSAVSQERQELEDRIQRYLKSQELALTGAGPRQDQEADPQEFWESWSGLQRTNWILAYYAENLGDMVVVRASLRPCRECGGVGVLEFTATAGGSQSRLDQCGQCHGVAVQRRISYR